MSHPHPSASVTKGGVERRKTPRFPVRERLLGLLIDDDRPVRIRDLSAGGFSTETVEPLHVGLVQRVRFTAHDDRHTVLQARSLHSRPSCAVDGSPCYVTGFAFIIDAPDARERVDFLIEWVTSLPRES
jgi:hypothetical protein